jgi:hypothetical protein
VIPLPLALVAVGAGALVLAAIVLRSFGPGYRLGRLLAGTPQVTVEEAMSQARQGDGRYVRVDGRIDSATEFEDEHHRPLVFRRRRIQTRVGNRWQTVDERREAVAFAVNEGLASMPIDTDSLGDGLVVIPREATGTAAEARDLVPTDVTDETPVRMRIEQVSSVEHAIVLGVPVATGDGSVVIGPGHGRPLVLTTLEVPEAMRLLAGGRRARTALVAILAVTGAAAILAGLVWALLGGLR